MKNYLQELEKYLIEEVPVEVNKLVIETTNTPSTSGKSTISAIPDNENLMMTVSRGVGGKARKAIARKIEYKDIEKGAIKREGNWETDITYDKGQKAHTIKRKKDK